MPRETRHLVERVVPLYQFQKGMPRNDERSILGIYNVMYDAFFEERSLIGEGRFCEVGIDDLDPGLATRIAGSWRRSFEEWGYAP